MYGRDALDAIHNVAENATKHVEQAQEALTEIVRMTRNGNAADAQEQRTETETRTLSRKHATDDARQTFNALANSIPPDNETAQLIDSAWNQYVELSDRYEQVIRHNRDSFRRGYKEAKSDESGIVRDDERMREVVEQAREYALRESIATILYRAIASDDDATRRELLRAARDIQEETTDQMLEDIYEHGTERETGVSDTPHTRMNINLAYFDFEAMQRGEL